jgi:hypothetical protein
MTTSHNPTTPAADESGRPWTNRASFPGLSPSHRPTDAEPPLAAPASLVVFVNARGAIDAVSTDVEAARGRVAGHWFASCTAYTGVPLDAQVSPGAIAAAFPFQGAVSVAA